MDGVDFSGAAYATGAVEADGETGGSGGDSGSDDGIGVVSGSVSDIDVSGGGFSGSNFGGDDCTRSDARMF